MAIRILNDLMRAVRVGIEAYKTQWQLDKQVRVRQRQVAKEALAQKKKDDLQIFNDVKKLVEDVMATDISKKSLPELQTLADQLNMGKNTQIQKFYEIGWDNHEYGQLHAYRHAHAKVANQLKPFLKKQEELDSFNAKLDLIAAKFGTDVAGKVVAIQQAFNDTAEAPKPAAAQKETCIKDLPKTPALPSFDD